MNRDERFYETMRLLGIKQGLPVEDRSKEVANALAKAFVNKEDAIILKTLEEEASDQ